MKKIGLLLSLVLFVCTATAGQRIKYTINDNWKFNKGVAYDAHKPTFDDAVWDVVNIPHTWNNVDADDSTPGFYRGVAWYRRDIDVAESNTGKQVFVYFEGANQVVQLYVNGHYAGEHTGGYTRFNFDVTKYINYGEKNSLAIRVDNAHNPNIPPLSADFTFFGGIYRDVYMVYTDKVHVSLDHYSSSGVYIKTPKVTEKSAVVEFTTHLSNDTDKATSVLVEHTIADGFGGVVESVSEVSELEIGESIQVQSGIEIKSPRLWDIDDPHRYMVYTKVYDAETKELLDEVSNPMGLRWFSFDSEKGFYLNGRHHKLTGSCRHQDYLGKGYALSDDMHVRDLMLLKNMGGNFLRVSHYPQDPIIMEMCDKLGIVTSVEIPIVNAVTETQEFTDNSVHMVKEMIYQDFNRPSVVMWAYMNEVLLRPPYKGDEVRMNQYYKDVEKVARVLESCVRTTDPTRYTMMAYHNAPYAYERANLTDIPMIQGWNLYQGWYEPDINDFQRLLDRANKEYKGKSIIVTEYGPGVDPRLHSFNSERFDFTQEYGLIYHRHYLKEMLKRDFVTGFSMWNLNDFYSEPRVDAVPHVNNKGVTGLDREKKDTYLFYEVSLNKIPLLYVGNKEWKSRGGVANRGEAVCVQPLPIFTNQKSATLTVNGESLGTVNSDGGVAMFNVPFINGRNHIVAKSGSLTDVLNVDFKLIPNNISKSKVPFTDMNVMLGSHRYFEDRVSQTAWIPEQEYKEGSWGYVGGDVYRRNTWAGSLLGSDADIRGTINHPIFQTQRVGIEEFRADVPDGQYSIYLYLAELDSESSKEALAYNLGGDAEQKEYKERRFDISINGTLVSESLCIAEDIGFSRAAIKKYEVIVKDGKGVSVKFDKIAGEPVLNAIRIYKN